MIRSKIFRSLLVLSSVSTLSFAGDKKLVPLSAALPKDTTCRERWAQWLNRYAGVTPLVSRSKTLSGWTYSEATLQAAMKGNVPPLGDEANSLLFGTQRSTSTEAWKGLKLPRLTAQEDTRASDRIAVLRYHREFHDHPGTAPGGRTKGRRVTVAIVEPALADRYFFAHPHYLATYAHPPFSPASESGNAALRKVVKNGLSDDGARPMADRLPIGMRARYGELAAPQSVLAPLMRLNAWNQRSEFPAEWLLRNDYPPGLFVIVADDPYLDAPELFSDLPSGACLAEMEVSEVEVLWDGQKRSMMDLDRKTLAKELHPAAALERAGTMTALKKLDPAFAAAFAKDGLVLHPVRQSLLEKLAEYESAGVTIRIRGMELDARYPATQAIRDFAKIATEVDQLRVDRARGARISAAVGDELETKKVELKRAVESVAAAEKEKR